MVRNPFAAIEVAAHDDGTHRLHIAGTDVASFTTREEADAALGIARTAYREGLRFQKAATATALRDLLNPGFGV